MRTNVQSSNHPALAHSTTHASHIVNVVNEWMNAMKQNLFSLSKILISGWYNIYCVCVAFVWQKQKKWAKISVSHGRICWYFLVYWWHTRFRLPFSSRSWPLWWVLLGTWLGWICDRISSRPCHIKQPRVNHTYIYFRSKTLAWWIASTMPGSMLATSTQVCLSGLFVSLSRLTTMQASPAPYVYSTNLSGKYQVWAVC
jgi:hypothetical protein